MVKAAAERGVAVASAMPPRPHALEIAGHHDSGCVIDCHRESEARQFLRRWDRKMLADPKSMNASLPSSRK